MNASCCCVWIKRTETLPANSSAYGVQIRSFTVTCPRLHHLLARTAVPPPLLLFLLIGSKGPDTTHVVSASSFLEDIVGICPELQQHSQQKACEITKRTPKVYLQSQHKEFYLKKKRSKCACINY